jgi:hypothetical protein
MSHRDDMDFDLGPLVAAMESLIPLHMAEMRHCTPAQLQARAARASAGLGTYGAAMMWGGRPTGLKLSAEAHGINAMAEGLAAAELLNPGSAAEVLGKLARRRGSGAS